MSPEQSPNDALAELSALLRQLIAERGTNNSQLERTTGYGRQQIGRAVAGQQVPSPGLAEALDVALHAAGRIVEHRQRADHERKTRRLGFTPAVPQPRVNMPTDVRYSAPVPRNVLDLTDVEAIAATTTALRSIDNRFGGAHAHQLASAYLDTTVTGLLRNGGYSERIGSHLLGAAAQLAHLAGWTAYDIADNSRAEKYFARALDLSIAANDDAFCAEILAARSHHAIHLGAPGVAIDLAHAALRIGERADVPALLAEAHTLEANAQALLGEQKLCVKALSKAESAFTRSARENMPEWAKYIDRSYMAARFAHTLRDNHDFQSAERFALEATAMSGDRVRTRLFNTVLLATVYSPNDPDRAVHSTEEAFAMASGLQSARALSYLRDLCARLERHHGSHPQVRSMRSKFRPALEAV